MRLIVFLLLLAGPGATAQTPWETCARRLIYNTFRLEQFIEREQPYLRRLERELLASYLTEQLYVAGPVLFGLLGSPEISWRLTGNIRAFNRKSRSFRGNPGLLPQGPIPDTYGRQAGGDPVFLFREPSYLPIGFVEWKHLPVDEFERTRVEFSAYWISRSGEYRRFKVGTLAGPYPHPYTMP